MPDIRQDDAVIYYVTFDGRKGHTCFGGHVVRTPHDFLLVTEDREEWEDWHECSEDCDLCSSSEYEADDAHVR